MRKLFLTIAISGILLVSCAKKTVDPVSFVNPLIGNISHLLVPTYPTVHIPNSMLRFTPNRENYTSNLMQGFPLNLISHRSGKIFNLVPFSGDPGKAATKLNFTYDNESVTPFSYFVTLDEDDISVKFAPAQKSGFFLIKPGNPEDHGIALRVTGNGELSFSDNTISGHDLFKGVKTYLYLEFDREVTGIKAIEGRKLSDQVSASGRGNGLVVLFGKTINEGLKIRYGISFISIEQAKLNLHRDIPDWNFTRVISSAREKWNNVLSSIIVEGGTDNQKTVFYTSLYRCFERMIDITEDGRYFSVWSNKVEDAADTSFHTDDWVWDTYLALHPLQAILNPSRQAERITSYNRMARQSGWMPTFPTVTGDNHAMNGNHFAGVVLDSWNKGIRDFNLAEIYDHLKNTILHETRLPWVKDSATWLDKFYDRKGYYPALDKDEAETCLTVHAFEKRQAVAVTLATCYDDWCMAQLASELGREEDHDFFMKRSHNHRNLFNRETGFYHPKDSSGNWIEPFDYRYDGGLGARDYYDENNGWTYIWQPYHAFDDLIDMMGGTEKFLNKLDQLFSEPLGRSKWEYYATLPDATGNVGQFVMGNEPSMHIPYLYNLAGKPWETQKRVRMLMETWFRNDLMGIPGDEDGGGLSAFYVFSAMGFYPLTPGIPEYQVGSPVFNRISIRLPNGNKFVIVAKNNSDTNKYIRSAKLNGIELNEPLFRHADLANGGTLRLKMTGTPDRQWGIKEPVE